MLFTVHGIEFERSGECTRCTGCSERCLNHCPHGKPDRNGGSICTVHSRKHLPCKECSDKSKRLVTHQVCIDFPDHPWLHVMRSGKCEGYSFKRTDGGSVDELPFVDGTYLEDE